VSSPCCRPKRSQRRIPAPSPALGDVPSAASALRVAIRLELDRAASGCDAEVTVPKIFSGSLQSRSDL